MKRVVFDILERFVTRGQGYKNAHNLEITHQILNLKTLTKAMARGSKLTFFEIWREGSICKVADSKVRAILVRLQNALCVVL